MQTHLDSNPEKWYNILATDNRPSRFFMPKLAIKNLICYYLIVALVVKRLALSVAGNVTRLLRPFFVGGYYEQVVN